MHYKYALLCCSHPYTTALKKDILDNHTIGREESSGPTGKDMMMVYRRWSTECIAVATVEGKGYFYEDLVKYAMRIDKDDIFPVQVTKSRLEVVGGTSLQHDTLTMYDEKGEIIYPIMAPASTVMDFKEYIRYVMGISVYTNDELQQLRVHPKTFLRALDNGKYKLVGKHPWALYFNQAQIMTYAEIEKELSLHYSGAKKDKSKLAINFKGTDFTKVGHYNSPIDLHSGAIIRSLGYDIVDGEWESFITDIMDENEALLGKLRLITYRAEYVDMYKDAVANYPKLKDWINRLLAKGHDVYGYGDFLQILPFIHLTSQAGEYYDPLEYIEYSVPMNCTSFMIFKDIDEDTLASEGYTIRGQPNFINRLGMYKAAMPHNTYFTVLRFY